MTFVKLHLDNARNTYEHLRRCPGWKHNYSEKHNLVNCQCGHKKSNRIIKQKMSQLIVSSTSVRTLAVLEKML
jgi:hypothetical protein